MDACRAEFAGSDGEVGEAMVFLEAVEAAKTADKATLIKFIKENGLVREHVPTNFLNSVNVS